MPIMKMIDKNTELLQCRCCGHTHTAEPAPRWYLGNRRHRWGTFRCWAGCTWEMYQERKARERLDMINNRRGKK